MDAEIKSHLSFSPYYKHLQVRIQNPKEQFSGIYSHIVKKLEAYPELLQPFNNTELLEKHEDLFQLIAATIFPFSDDVNLQYFALGTPYKFEIFFYSASFSGYFNPDSNGYITFPPERPFEQLQNEYMLMAYKMIFKKFFEVTIKIPERRTNQWIDSSTGLRRYSRIHIDESFIDLRLTGELPAFPEHLIDRTSGAIIDQVQLHQQFPLSLFAFEGFIMRRSIADVTLEECVTEVKNAMILMQSEDPLPGYEKLRSAVETMLGIKDVEVSLSPFIKLNDKFVYYNKYSGKSILLKGLTGPEKKEDAYQHLSSLLSKEKMPLHISNLKDAGTGKNKFPLLPYLQHSQYSSYFVTPLFHNDELIGMMEAATHNAGVLNDQTIKKLEPVHTFFEIMCRNDIDHFNNEIDSLILERYTALLPVVEWKFLEEAWTFMKEREKDPSIEIGEVSFDDVYPFYGAVDIKDSSTERSACFQKDILDHFDLVDITLSRLKDTPRFSQNGTCNKLLEKNKGFRQKAEQGLKAEDEVRINEFLEIELQSFFNQLTEETKSCPDPVAHYQKAIDPDSGSLNKNRLAYDISIGTLNKTISQYLETEQDKIQPFYPHYFEKFKTDGVDYNMYMGQSFTPIKNFEIEELQKIRLWQLSVMADITRMTHRLEKNIPIPLKTTQLILIYSTPICISFRKEERRFDVKGTESIKFEILKKRIDKVKIKNTGERLTKPGTIAIIYSHPREVEEYNDYFHLLEKNNVITSDIERVDLEDVQSISGLKAIRIHIIFND